MEKNVFEKTAWEKLLFISNKFVSFRVRFYGHRNQNAILSQKKVLKITKLPKTFILQQVALRCDLKSFANKICLVQTVLHEWIANTQLSSGWMGWARLFVHGPLNHRFSRALRKKSMSVLNWKRTVKWQLTEGVWVQNVVILDAQWKIWNRRFPQALNKTF